MQAYMMPLKAQGLIEPEEERRQWVFHVAVSGSYADWREARTIANDRTVNQPADGPQPEALAANSTEQ